MLLRRPPVLWGSSSSATGELLSVDSEASRARGADLRGLTSLSRRPHGVALVTSPVTCNDWVGCQERPRTRFAVDGQLPPCTPVGLGAGYSTRRAHYSLTVMEIPEPAGPPYIDPDREDPSRPVCGICPATRYLREQFLVYNRPSWECPFHPRRTGTATPTTRPCPPASTRTRSVWSPTGSPRRRRRRQTRAKHRPAAGAGAFPGAPCSGAVRYDAPARQEAPRSASRPRSAPRCSSRSCEAGESR